MSRPKQKNNQFIVIKIRNTDLIILNKFMNHAKQQGKTKHDLLLELQNYIKTIPVKPDEPRRPVQIGIPSHLLTLLRGKGTRASPWLHLLLDAIRAYLTKHNIS
jgi:hypothetical protein